MRRRLIARRVRSPTCQVRQRGQFLWHNDMEEPRVRDRSALPQGSRSTELIPPEEIAVAILREVERSFTIARSDAVSRVARAFGFRRVTDDIGSGVERVVSMLVTGGKLNDDDGVLSTVP